MTTGRRKEQIASSTIPVACEEPPAPGEGARSPEVGDCLDQPMTARVEAILLATDRPISASRIAEVLGLEGRGGEQEGEQEVAAAIDELNAHYQQTGRSFFAERRAGGWQLMTRPNFASVLYRLHADRQQARLSQAALETLAVIAYRQPIMRAELEAIRGVASGDVLRGLLERRLIKIVGRAEELGRPMLYGTSREFLNVFGLASLEDLPPVEESRRLKADSATAVSHPETNASATVALDAVADSDPR